MHLWPLIAWPRRFRIQAFDSGRRPWEPDLSAIWREAAAGSDGPVHQTHRICSFCCRCAPDRRQGGAPPRRLPRLPGRGTSAGIANNAPLVSHRLAGLLRIAGGQKITHHDQNAVTPPSTASECPVVNAAPSLHRYSTALAISSTLPMRPTGCMVAANSALRGSAS